MNDQTKPSAGFRWAYCGDCWARWPASQGTDECPDCQSQNVEVGEPEEPVFEIPEE